MIFFDIRGVIYIDLMPEGKTVNQVYYKNVLTILRERVRRRIPGDAILEQHNTR